MGELKQRYYVTPSSLASYFGCGFNSPEEQYAIDKGDIAADFDDDSKLRMALGNHLEDAVINYFEKEVFKTPITDRNTELKWGYDDKILYKIDGKITYKGEPAIFENKVSNSQSYRFTDNVGYHIQVQTYMLCEGYNRTILAGLYQGKPIYKIIDINEDMINDIKRVVDFVYSCLNGLGDFEKDYPRDILEKYGVEKIYEPIDNLSEYTIDYLHKLAELNAQKSAIEKEIKELNATHESDFDISEGVYEDDFVKVRVSKWVQKGKLDTESLMLDNPDIDFSKYITGDTVRTKTVVKLK